MQTRPDHRPSGFFIPNDLTTQVIRCPPQSRVR
ncbi:uncharacterized protein METZ01_LOCUS337082, partial [marine metagenome]